MVDGKVLTDKDDDQPYDRNGHKGSKTSSLFLDNPNKTFGAYCEDSHTSWKNIFVESM
jgi:hypothetical protein